MRSQRHSCMSCSLWNHTAPKITKYWKYFVQSYESSYLLCSVFLSFVLETKSHNCFVCCVCVLALWGLGWRHLAGDLLNVTSRHADGVQCVSASPQLERGQIDDQVGSPERKGSCQEWHTWHAHVEKREKKRWTEAPFTSLTSRNILVIYYSSENVSLPNTPAARDPTRNSSGENRFLRRPWFSAFPRQSSRTATVISDLIRSQK